MKFLFVSTVSLLLLLPVAVLAAPANSKNEIDPCRTFAELQKGRVAGLDAKLWRQCIQNVPFSATKAAATLKNLRIFLGMDTYAHYMLSPPTQELELSPFDLNKTLSAIEEKVGNAGYKSNWAFDRELVELFQSFRDGHTDYETVCTHGFLYVHDFPITSIASDNGLPELYHVLKDFSATPWAPPKLGSKISTINGQPAAEYMDEFIRSSSEALDWVDPDARYNQVLYGYPEGAFRGTFARRNMWDGEEIKIGWENGTETSVEFTVQMLSGYLHVNGLLLFNDTQSLQGLCFLSEAELAAGRVKRSVAQLDVEERELIPRAVAPPNGYPNALADSAEYAMSTYPVPGDEETVVLNIRTFDAIDLGSAEFVQAMSTFLTDQIASWKKTGYKRLIIDVSNNDGGKAILPYDILKQLFPTQEDFPAVNMHYSPLTWAYMHSIDGGKEDQMYRDVNMKDFADMADFLGPVYKDGDYFSKMWKQDYVQFGLNYGINVSTIASTTGSQPFKPENIAVVSNSLCASACHSLVESLRSRGVRAFAYGGRPNKTSPMQPVGGTKGGKVLRYDTVRQVVSASENNDLVIAAAGPVNTWKLEQLPVRIKNLNINSENKFRDNVRLPLQFVYTPACNRFFLDKDMLADVSSVWKKTRDMAWGVDGSPTTCVNYAAALASGSGDESGGANDAGENDGTGSAHGHKSDSVGLNIWRHMGHDWRWLPWLGLWAASWLGFLV